MLHNHSLQLKTSGMLSFYSSGMLHRARILPIMQYENIFTYRNGKTEKVTYEATITLDEEGYLVNIERY